MIIGTRGSRLAMVQTDMALRSIRAVLPTIEAEVKVITTGGDRDRRTPLESMGGYGVFTKELDQRLLSGEIDLAVNSLKDMPSVLTPGTRLVAVLPRGPVADTLVSRMPFESLPAGAIIGTSSVRRRALVRHLRPDLVVEEVRGNVTTRVNKCRKGEYQAIVLADAGLSRLGDVAPRHPLDPKVWVPPAGQGAIALVCREEDRHADALSALDHWPTRACVDLERSVMLGLGASCQVPLGIWANEEDGGVTLRCLWLGNDGSWAKRWEGKIPIDHGIEAERQVIKEIKEDWAWPE